MLNKKIILAVMILGWWAVTLAQPVHPVQPTQPVHPTQPSKSAQPVQPAKPALDHSVYDGWKSYGRIELTQGRDTLIYELNPQVGEGATYYICLATGKSGEYPMRSEVAAEKPASPSAEAPIVKLWAWDDDYLVPEKEKRAGQKEPELPKSAFHKVFWGTDSRYRAQQQWELEVTADYYVTDTITGESELVMEGAVIKYDGFSPDGRSVCYLDCPTGVWHLFDIDTKRDIPLTADSDGIFTDNENDTPSWPFGYNWAKWSSDSRTVYIQDKYDVWAYELEKRTLNRLTDGFKSGITLRWRTDVAPCREAANSEVNETSDFIDNEKDLYLNLFDNATKESGLAVLRRSNGKVETLFKGPYSLGKIFELEGGFVVQKGNFETGWDLYFVGNNGAETRLTDINPQRMDYNWGTAELVSWTVSEGRKSEGILFKPEDFDPSKTYPVLVYLYERNSSTLFAVRNPAPVNAAINVPYFVSNGYVVFIPDIRYKIGHPGRSAVEYVLSGLDMLCEYPWIDSEHIGIQGQSWGGYETAFIVTQTDRFAAACAGAPVSNMTSAYSGIRTSTGKSRQYLYEQSQSRIGTDLWDRLDLYLENSPLFYVPQVTTPLLIMHADDDGAVPFSQGVELFSALKRCGKKAWLLQYVGEPHDLGSREAVMDYTLRVCAFFDHYLKGSPPPEWL